MENKSMLLGILLICLFMVPILYVIFSNMVADQKRLKTIHTMCKAKNVNVKTLETIGNTIIGVDTDFEYLIFAERMNIQESLEIIPLKDLKSCSVKAIRVKNKSLDSVELYLTGVNFNKEIILYKEEDESNMADSEACLYEASLWEKRLRQRLQLG